MIHDKSGAGRRAAVLSTMWRIWQTLREGPSGAHEPRNSGRFDPQSESKNTSFIGKTGIELLDSEGE